MRKIKKVNKLYRMVRYSKLIILLVVGIIAVSCLFPLGRSKARWLISQWWARQVLNALGVEMVVEGDQGDLKGPLVIISNHISWVDIPVILALFKVHFVSKSDIKSWPIIGFLAAKTGTIFLEKKNKRSLPNVVKTLGEALDENKKILLFPEGTTGRGDSVLPFRSPLLEVAVKSKTSVVPIAIRYFNHDSSPNFSAAYVDDDTFMKTLVRIVSAPVTRVKVNIAGMIYPEHTDRKNLAMKLRDQVQFFFTQET